MSQKTEDKFYPIQHYVKIILFISFFALILDIIISFASIAIVKQQSAQNIQDTARLYINRINSDFSYINHFMGWSLANDENLKIMKKRDVSDQRFIKANNSLFRRFAELQLSYDKAYNFFIYLQDKSFLANCAPMRMDYADYQKFKEMIDVYINDKNMYDKFYSRWSSVQLNGKYFIVNIVPYHDAYIICLIEANDLIRPLREINLGEYGFASLTGEDGKSMTSRISNEGKQLGESRSQRLLDFVLPKTTVYGEFANESFYVELVIQFGAFEKMMIAQLLIVLLAVIVAGSLCFIMLYFKNKVLQPIKSFHYNLAFWTENGEPLHIGSNKIFELEKANRQFLILVDQIKSYKIDIYERELEKQRIQLDYMKLQIKPHFFLNCLTTIYSMAQMNMYEEIQQMTLSTSDYFRYIFQNGRDFVRMEDEIEHVRIYLEIQRNRFQDAFAYLIEREAAVRETPVPPLLLQTFIENAIKYAVSRDRMATITLGVRRRIEEEEAMTEIRIADTGPGFQPDILEKLQQGMPLDQTNGTQIGIMNAIQRLSYLYGERAKVRFANQEGGGACIVLYLPEFSANKNQD